MYYEERIIDGVLCYRTSSTGPWEQMSLQRVTELYLSLQKEVMKTCALLEQDLERLVKLEKDMRDL